MESVLEPMLNGMIEPPFVTLPVIVPTPVKVPPLIFSPLLEEMEPARRVVLPVLCVNVPPKFNVPLAALTEPVFTKLTPVKEKVAEPNDAKNVPSFVNVGLAPPPLKLIETGIPAGVPTEKVAPATLWIEAVLVKNKPPIPSTVAPPPANNEPELFQVRPESVAGVVPFIKMEKVVSNIPLPEIVPPDQVTELLK